MLIGRGRGKGIIFPPSSKMKQAARSLGWMEGLGQTSSTCHGNEQSPSSVKWFTNLNEASPKAVYGREVIITLFYKGEMETQLGSVLCRRHTEVPPGVKLTPQRSLASWGVLTVLPWVALLSFQGRPLPCRDSTVLRKPRSGLYQGREVEDWSHSEVIQ